jgi:hypothetical protein
MESRPARHIFGILQHHVFHLLEDVSDDVGQPALLRRTLGSHPIDRQVQPIELTAYSWFDAAVVDPP